MKSGRFFFAQPQQERSRLGVILVGYNTRRCCNILLKFAIFLLFNDKTRGINWWWSNLRLSHLLVTLIKRKPILISDKLSTNNLIWKIGLVLLFAFKYTLDNRSRYQDVLVTYNVVLQWVLLVLTIPSIPGKSSSFLIAPFKTGLINVLHVFWSACEIVDTSWVFLDYHTLKNTHHE